MKFNQIIQAWIDYCNQVLPDEWTVTRAEEVTGKDAPRPQGPYITLKIISGPRKITMDDELRFNGKSEGKNNFNLVGQRAYTLSVKSFRAGHNDALSDISTYLDDPDFCEILKEKACISVTNKGDVLDISGLIDTGFEGRSQLDIFFNSSNNRETRVGLIENVEIEGETRNEGFGNIINTNQTINKE
jgi:hypothetical protein